MENFPSIWMTDICNELNRAGFEMPDYQGKGKFDFSRLDGSTDLMLNHVTFNSRIYEHLNTKGFVNRGYCPITGEKIGTTYFYQLFGRIVYLSESGQRIAKEWNRQEHIKVFGKEPMTPTQKQEAYKDIRSHRRLTFLISVVIILFIIYLFKKC